MKYLISFVVLLVAYIVISLTMITILQRQLEDCRFEYNHLQTRLTQCQELSDCAEALEQTLPVLAWAQVRALNEEIKQKRHWKYEGAEMPLLADRE